MTAAKKGGKGGGKKGPGSLMNIPKPSEQAAQQAPKKDPWTEANVRELPLREHLSRVWILKVSKTTSYGTV